MGLFSNNVTITKVEDGVETKVDYYQYTVNKIDNIESSLKTQEIQIESLNGQIQELNNTVSLLICIIVIYVIVKGINKYISYSKKKNSHLN